MGTPVVVFDLDDTLTDWWTAIGVAAEEVSDTETASRFAAVVRDKAWDRRADGAVHRAHWKLRVDPLMFWREVSAGSDAERLAERFVDRLRPVLYDDVVPTLVELSPRARLGVLTNSPYVDVELEALEIADRFATVVGVVDPIRKPHPDAFGRLLAELDERPEDVWYVGDSPVADVEPSLALGMRAVWVDRFGDQWDPPGGVLRIQSLAELVDVIDGDPDA